MSQIEYSQTLGQQEEMEHLLTKESFDDWLKKMSPRKFAYILKNGFTYKEYYLKEHGLPIDSEIKGL